MLHRRWPLLLSLLMLALVVAAPGCKKRPPETAPSVPAAAPKAPQPPPPPPPKQEVKDEFEGAPFEDKDRPPSDLGQADHWNKQGVLSTVYFDFDRSDLTEPTRQTLRKNADWLEGHGELNVVVEGHCDERGSIEYNLALGERRANAVRDYLIDLGVERSRLRIVSFGEERPAVPGTGESVWSRNRRAEFVLEEP
jgi:peptidoglycan-associated lipoprotein